MSCVESLGRTAGSAFRGGLPAPLCVRGHARWRGLTPDACCTLATNPYPRCNQCNRKFRSKYAERRRIPMTCFGGIPSLAHPASEGGAASGGRQPIGFAILGTDYCPPAGSGLHRKVPPRLSGSLAVASLLCPRLYFFLAPCGPASDGRDGELVSLAGGVVDSESDHASIRYLPR